MGTNPNATTCGLRRTPGYFCAPTWPPVGSIFPPWTGSSSMTLLIRLRNTSTGLGERPGGRVDRAGKSVVHASYCDRLRENVDCWKSCTVKRRRIYITPRLCTMHFSAATKRPVCRALLFLLPEEVGFLRYLRAAKVRVTCCLVVGAGAYRFLLELGICMCGFACFNKVSRMQQNRNKAPLTPLLCPLRAHH